MIQFQELVSATIDSLVQRNMPQHKLVSHVMTLGTFDPVFKEPQVPVFCHCFQELKAANTTYEIFLVFNNYFSFFNYQLIEHIIKALGTKEDKAKLQKYKDDFNQYAKRRIFECPPDFGTLNDDADHADIFVKVDSQYENYTVAEIEGFRQKLSKILHLSSQGILRLCRVDKGCFQLLFQVPAFVQQEIFPLSRKQENALAAMGVIRLACGEHWFQVTFTSVSTCHCNVNHFTAGCGMKHDGFCCIINYGNVCLLFTFCFLQKDDPSPAGEGMCILSSTFEKLFAFCLPSCFPFYREGTPA